MVDLTLIKVEAAIRELKSEKTFGEDEIQFKMLKALIVEGVHWLTKV